MTKQRPWLATLLASAALVAFYRSHVRPWMYRWGATPKEITTKLPGDELLQPGVTLTTRAISIDAPVEHVWPWMAQLGEGRSVGVLSEVHEGVECEAASGDVGRQYPDVALLGRHRRSGTKSLPVLAQRGDFRLSSWPPQRCILKGYNEMHGGTVDEH